MSQAQKLVSLEIRKQKREETMKKRRDAMEGSGIDAQAEGFGPAQEESIDPDLQAKASYSVDVGATTKHPYRLPRYLPSLKASSPIT